MKVILKIKATVTDVTDWYEDDREYSGTASHIGDHETRVLLCNEEEEKKESDKWCREHLPATFVFTSDPPTLIDDNEYEEMLDDTGHPNKSLFEDYVDRDKTEQEVISRMSDMTEHCYGDLLKPESLDFDIEVLEVNVIKKG